MNLSWKWLSDWVDLSVLKSPESLAEILTSRGIEVEEVKPLAKGLEQVIVAHLLKREKHPDSDRLSLCHVQTSDQTNSVLEIVCGAQNMKSGDKVALAQVGAVLPNGIKIEKSKIRGVVSNGMLCSVGELGFKDQTDEGILILPQDAPVGTLLSEYLGLKDTIFTIKPTANRGDCLGHLGIAREIAAALNQTIKRQSKVSLDGKNSSIQLKLEAGESGPQFCGASIEGVKVGASPQWMVARLESLGLRSINNVVDATNLILLETGHPVHAYDAHCIEGNELKITFGKKNEKLSLLDGTEIVLTGDELVIADGKKAVGLAGVMGGSNSQVSSDTQDVFLECAEFLPKNIRLSSQLHQKKTDASYRFERNVDPADAQDVLERLVTLVLELAGGKVKGSQFKYLDSRDPKKKLWKKTISVTKTYFTQFLGFEVSSQEINKVLESLECDVQSRSNEVFEVIPPSYRNDLRLKEDLAEEIVRSLGYHKIPESLPEITSLKPQTQDHLFRAKDVLVEAGFIELPLFSFTSRTWLKNLDFDLNKTVKILNPLSEEYEFLLPALIPSLLKSFQENERHSFGSEIPSFRLFQLRPVFGFQSPHTQVSCVNPMETTIKESWKLAFIFSGQRYQEALKAEQNEVDFFDLKGILEGLLERLGITRGVRILSQTPKGKEHVLSDQQLVQLFHLFHPGKSAQVWAGEHFCGWIGALHPSYQRKLKIKSALWMAELDWNALWALIPAQASHFKSWSEFPPMERDYALLVEDSISAEKLLQVAQKAGKPLLKSCRIFDVYRGAQVPSGKTSIAIKIIFAVDGRSLQELETEQVSAKIKDAWKSELGVVLRS